MIPAPRCVKPRRAWAAAVPDRCAVVGRQSPASRPRGLRRRSHRRREPRRGAGRPSRPRSLAFPSIPLVLRRRLRLRRCPRLWRCFAALPCRAGLPGLRRGRGRPVAIAAARRAGRPSTPGMVSRGRRLRRTDVTWARAEAGRPGSRRYHGPRRVRERLVGDRALRFGVARPLRRLGPGRGIG